MINRKFRVIIDINMDLNVLIFSGNYSVAQLCILFNRKSGFCFLQLIIPATSVVAASWISLWLEEETTFSDILAIILSVIFLSYSYNTVMPKVSYVKVKFCCFSIQIIIDSLLSMVQAMDMYLGACFLFAFFSLVKLAVVKYMRKVVIKRDQRRQHQVDPSMESSGNFIYFF